MGKETVLFLSGASVLRVFERVELNNVANSSDELRGMLKG